MCAPFEGISPTYMRIAKIGIQIGGQKGYYHARRVRTIRSVLGWGGTPQSHHHTVVSAPSVDQPDMDMNFVPS